MSKKEVLIVGPNFYGYNESVAKAFQVKGFKTNIINFEEENIPVTGNKLIDKFLLKAKREYYVNEYGKKVNKEVIDFVDKNNIKNIVSGSMYDKNFEVNTSKIIPINPTNKFAKGAAIETFIASLYLLLYALGFVFNGLVHPNPANRIIIKPIKSICAAGVKVNLPWNLGVLSPNLSATKAFAYPCTVNAINIAGIFKII